MEFVYAKALYPEKRGFTLERHEKNGEYIFVHFLSPVLLEKDGRMIEVSAGGCIVWDKNSYRNFFSPDCDLLHNWFHATGDVPEVLSRYGIKFGEIYYPAPDDFITSYIQKIEMELLQNSAVCREIGAHIIAGGFLFLSLLFLQFQNRSVVFAQSDRMPCLQFSPNRRGRVFGSNREMSGHGLIAVIDGNHVQ